MEKNRNSPDGKSIWKDAHTPMKGRKTSSGLTFWPKKVKDSEQK